MFTMYRRSSSCPQLGLVKYNIKLTRLLSHDLYRKVRSVFFSYTPQYIEEILGTSECRNGYGTHTEMEIVSCVSSCPQLGLV